MYGLLMAKILEPQLQTFINSSIVVLILQTLISTLLVLISAEFLPKTIFRINPNRTLNIFSVPVWILYMLLRPIVYLTIGLSNIILKNILKTEIKEDKPVFGKVDLDDYVQEALSQSNSLNDIEPEVQIFQNALGFAEVKTRECMVPRTEIVAIDMDSTTIKELREKFIETGLSKILVNRENIDNIIGYTHSFDLFKNPEGVKNIVLPISIVPETMPANEALKVFIEKNRGIAIVVDEFGGTSGMITLEDLVEEIFGEIEDEHDSEELMEEQLAEGKFKLAARLEIDYLNEKYRLNLPISEEYETLAGFIISRHESIPQKADQITIDNFKIEILEVAENRIHEVILTFTEQDE